MMGYHMYATRQELEASMSNEHALQVAKEEFLRSRDGFNLDADSAPVSSSVNVAAPEYTGGSVSYYRVEVPHPTSKGVHPYMAECNDIIEALQMNYAEGNAFKAIWRMCAARLGKSKLGYKDGLYDAEKVEFFGKRMVAQNQGEK